MTINDPIGDMLTRIRNGQMSSFDQVECPASSFREGVLRVLKQEGYIRGYSNDQVRPGIRILKIQLKFQGGIGAIQWIKRVSKPGQRVYSSIDSLSKVCSGLGVSILSTSLGVLSHLEARNKKVGGEVLCQVF